MSEDAKGWIDSEQASGKMVDSALDAKKLIDFFESEGWQLERALKAVGMLMFAIGSDMENRAGEDEPDDWTVI